MQVLGKILLVNIKEKSFRQVGLRILEKQGRFTIIKDK